MAEKELSFTINRQAMRVPEGMTVLEAAGRAGVRIPTLCHLDLHDIRMVNQTASCRVCMVELASSNSSRNRIVPACVTKVSDGMEVLTNTPRAVQARRMAVELLLSNHPNECFTCAKNLECELQALAAELGIREIRMRGGHIAQPIDQGSGALVKNPNKCIYCRRCETMCNTVQTCGILSGIGRGFEAAVGPAFGLPMAETSCTYCGQCAQVCPTAALTEVSHVDSVWRAINDPGKHVIVQTAPAVRVALGELFGMEPGAIVTGKMVTALRRMGFDAVFDTDFGADLTVIEEAAELLHRIREGGTLPMLTSCCPAWVKFIEHQFPALLDIPSTCKSPHIMLGIVAKTYYAQQAGIDPGDIVVVSVMPCIAKKAEAKRPELTKDKNDNVDIVVTTRELGRMIREAGLAFAALPDSDFDHPLGESSGASVLFGSTGGVIEAVVRTAHEWLTGEELEQVDYEPLRGMDGLRRATVNLAGQDIHIGIASGLGNARALLEEIQSGKSGYTAIEIMACPGGCVAGGGQPYHHGNYSAVHARQQALYRADQSMHPRKSHHNREILRLYSEFLGEPCGKTAHTLLHTYFERRERI